MLLAAGCPGKDDSGDAGEWTFVAEELDAALLSITGSGSDDVWAVGADAGSGPLVVHWDGSGWVTEDTQTTGDLWWVHLDGSDAAWMAGAGGRVIRHDRGAGTFTEEVLDADETLFGIWSGGDGTAWAVGGDLTVGAGGARLWRLDGTWSLQTLPAALSDTLALYKVWGAADDDVWFCGTDGAMIHWNGAALEAVDAGTTRTLFTVNGTGTDTAYAVGGFGNGALVEWNGSAWSDASPFQAPQLNGVASRGSDAVAVGRTGGVWWRGSDGWTEDPRGPATDLDFHGAWLDPAGDVWAVGGSISSEPLDRGLMVYGGESPPGELPQ